MYFYPYRGGGNRTLPLSYASSCCAVLRYEAVICASHSFRRSGGVRRIFFFLISHRKRFLKFVLSTVLRVRGGWVPMKNLTTLRPSGTSYFFFVSPMVTALTEMVTKLYTWIEKLEGKVKELQECNLALKLEVNLIKRKVDVDEEE